MIFFKKKYDFSSQNKTVNSKKNNVLCLILLILGLSISSFINLKKDPGFNGDDYAQYLHQSRNFVESKPQNETGLKYTEYLAYWGNPKYTSIGFPLILCPVYFLGGQKIIHFSTYISFLLFITGVILYFFYLKTFKNNILSLILVFIFTFNPYVVNFKASILSEIPFMLFILLIFYLYQFTNKHKNSSIFLISLLIGFTITIRPAGAPLILTTFLYPLILIFLFKEPKKNFKLLLIPIFSIIFYLIITKLIFKIPQDTYFQKSILVQKILPIDIYLKILKNLFYTFHEVIPQFKFIGLNIFIYTITLLSIFFGYLLKVFKKIELSEIFVIIYIIMLLYLNTSAGQGFRYLLPLFPFFIEYIYIFLNTIFFKSKIKYLFYTFIIIFLAINYNKIIKIHIQNNLNSLNEGVESPLAIETFNYINQNINPDKMIIFRESRTLALFTQNYTHPIIPFFSDQTIEDMKKKYYDIGSNYLLFDKKSPSPKEWWLEIFIKNNENVNLVWNNSRFYLYELKK